MDSSKKTDSTPHQSLYEYYKKQYPIDFELFKVACPTNKTSDIENKFYFIDDLEYLKKIKHPLLEKRHFIYFMVINIAFLMVVHEYFRDKYEEYRHLHRGIVFEVGLHYVYMSPWDILQKLDMSLDKELFQNCLGHLISDLFVNDNLCGIVPRDFIGKLTTDPDLINEKYMVGKEWEKMCMDEYLAIKID